MTFMAASTVTLMIRQYFDFTDLGYILRPLATFGKIYKKVFVNKQLNGMYKTTAQNVI